VTAPAPTLDTIFLAAIEIDSAEERAAHIARACGGDAELQGRVEQLVQAHFRAGSFLEKPVVAVIGTGAYTPGPANTPIPEDRAETRVGPGARIGPYKLLQQIGEGGMGSVFLAEQTQPVQRKVALKLIKSGMDSKQVIARFEVERQALALMDHPNIARVHDAGTTDAGNPWFVMELVKGDPITRYCDLHRLTPRQRLELFLPVCQAIQHAHQKGIIHRDVKPSNVLVAPYDGRPVVKVIDFGIAKATGQRLTEKTLFTEFGSVVGTLEYMSPEQAELNNQDIDTRSDVYSLGVLLYELLTGTTPLDRARLKKTAFTEMLRMIREEEPPRPSTRLAESKDTLPAISAQRRMAPAKLTNLVRGELDWIVMKALEKDRGRRYETANGFAMDVQRYLADEPVLACPASMAYRLKKVLRRNKGPVLAAALVLLALVGGIIGTTLGLLQARASEETAQTEAWNAGQERDAAQAARDRATDTLDAMTSHVVGSALARQTVVTPEQKLFLRTALEYYRQLLTEEASDDGARKRLAAAAFRVGLIEERLGRNEEGAAMFRQARDLYARLTADFPADAEYRRDLASSHGELAGQLRFLGKAKQAEPEYRAAVALEKKLASEFPADLRYRSNLARNRNNLGLLLLRELGEPAQGEVELRAATDLRKQLAAEFPAAPEYRRDLSDSHHNLGLVMAQLRKSDQAETHYRAAIAIRKKLAAEFPAFPDHRHLLVQSHINLGVLLGNLGKRQQAERELRAALAMQEKLVADFPSVPIYRLDLVKGYMNLGNVLTTLGKPDEAETHYRAARDASKHLVAEFPNNPKYRHHLAQCHIELGAVLDGLGKQTEAETEFRAAIKIGKPLVAECPTVRSYREDLANCHFHLGYLLHAGFGRLAQAESQYRAAIAIRKKLVDEFRAVTGYRSQLAASRNSLGVLLKTLGKPDQAETEQRAALDIRKTLVAEFPAVPAYRHDLAASHNNLGTLLRVQGKRQQAERELRAALAMQEKLVADFPAGPDYGIALGGSLCNLGHLVRQDGRRNDALVLYARAITTLTQLVRKEPALATARRFLRNSHEGRASTLDQLERYKEAAEDWARALNLAPMNEKTGFRLLLMRSRVLAGQITAALEDADLLARSESGNLVYDCASVYALAHAGTRDDKQAVRAVELLRRAIARGFRDVAHLKKNSNFASLIARDDFRRVLAELEAKKKESAPNR
jgi:serine/threonine protein kinase/tetratricopeptide (TPR) repeat protein